MEIPEAIKSKSLQVSCSSSGHDELNRLLQALATKDIEDIINGEKKEDIRALNHKIYQVCFNAVNPGHKTEKEIIEETAQLIFTESYYLKKAIAAADIKSVLIFLVVNSFLNIETNYLLSEQELSETCLQPLTHSILELLIGFKFEIQALPDAPYHEKKMMIEAEEGYTNNNIKRTYQLIEAIEAGGRGFHFNYLLENLIVLFARLNIQYFLKVLSALNHPQSFIFYLQNIGKDELLQLANKSTLNNKWLNFELIRQILKRKKKDCFDDSECLTVKNTLDRICSSDFKYFKQAIQYFNMDELLNASLGELLPQLTDSQISEIIYECFEIDKNANNHKARNLLLEHFTPIASEQQFKLLLTINFVKWEAFINSLLVSDDAFQNEILFTDFCDFIVAYYTSYVSDDDILLQMKDLINKIMFIDSEWSISKSNQMTKYYLYYSKLYLLSYAYRNKKLRDVHIVNQFAELNNNGIHSQRYFSDGNIQQLDRVTVNLNWGT
ncbi:hypothetical protein HZA73_09545 [candidate division TA06 bacterium]|nr:hypothetical protein [candidate division TA06 bacterium]